MTKKFISLLISVIMVVGLIPVMSVSAEVTVDRYETFETYTVKEFNTDFSASGTLMTVYDTGDSKNYTQKLTLGTDLSLKIIKKVGYDGKQTNVGEITINSCATSGQTPGSLRLLGNQIYGTGDVYVQEMDVYITDNPNVQPFMMYPIFIKGNQIGFGISTSKVEYEDVTPGWHRVKAVTLLSESGNNVIGYLDGELVSYKEYTLTNPYKYFQLNKYEPGYKTIIFDNIKLWSNPDKTTASSVYSDASAVPANSNITVDFTEMVLDVPDASPASVSTANVEMTKSDGTSVELASVTVGSDKKSIVIEPKEDFDNKMKYNVKVTGLKDMYDQIIPDYEFSFTTADETNITAAKPVFTKVDFEEGIETEVDALENGLINASYTLKNNASSAKSVVMLAVLKDEDTIKRFQIKSETIPAGATVSFNGGFKVENAETEKIEIFVWDDMCNMTPIVDKYTIDKDSITPSID